MGDMCTRGRAVQRNRCWSARLVAGKCAAGGQKDNKKIVGNEGGNYPSVQMVCPRDLGQDVGFVWRTRKDLGCGN